MASLQWLPYNCGLQHMYIVTQALCCTVFPCVALMHLIKSVLNTLGLIENFGSERDIFAIRELDTTQGLASIL